MRANPSARRLRHDGDQIDTDTPKRMPSLDSGDTRYALFQDNSVAYDGRGKSNTTEIGHAYSGNNPSVGDSLRYIWQWDIEYQNPNP